MCVCVCDWWDDSYSVTRNNILIITSACQSLRYGEIQCHVYQRTRLHSLFRDANGNFDFTIVMYHPDNG